MKRKPSYQKRIHLWALKAQSFHIALTAIFVLTLGHATSPTPTLRERSRDSQDSWKELYVTSCYDGDTCSARCSVGVQYTLRLAGIDAPELERHWEPAPRAPDQPGARASRDFLIERVVGKKSWVKLSEGDVYGRHIAWLYTEKHGSIRQNITASINHLMLSSGWAMHSPSWGAPKKERQAERRILQKAQRGAKKRKMGIWGLRERPQNPANYRIKK